MTTVKGTLNVDEAVTLDTTLGVTGDTTLGGDLAVTGDTTMTGNLTVAGEIECSSDATLKKNIRNIDNASDRLSALNGVAFDWIHNSKSTYGIIAQDVEEVLPEAVTGVEGHKKVNYNCVVGLLVEALKEQSEKICELEDLIHELRD